MAKRIIATFFQYVVTIKLRLKSELGYLVNKEISLLAEKRSFILA
jgi:hypothetical protein